MQMNGADFGNIKGPTRLGIGTYPCGLFFESFCRGMKLCELDDSPVRRYSSPQKKSCLTSYTHWLLAPSWTCRKWATWAIDYRASIATAAIEVVMALP
jgi:hypothetical protein